MYLVPINILIFHFSPSKKFLQLLVPIKSPFLVPMKCVEYCKNLSQKNLEFFNKT